MRDSPELVLKNRLSPEARERRMERKKHDITYQQRIMIRFLIAGLPLEEVAERVGVSKQRCQAWLRRDKVKQALEDRLSWYTELDAKRRKKRSEFIASELYRTIMQKFADGSLEKLNSKTLMKLLMEFQKEVRTDTPGEATKKVHHTVQLTEELANRFRQANSSNFQEREGKILDISIPKQLDTGEKHVKSQESVREAAVDAGED